MEPIDPSSNPSVDVDIVNVVVDAAIHANLDVEAIFFRVDGYVDGPATLYLADVVLCKVVMQLSNVMLLKMVVLP